MLLEPQALLSGVKNGNRLMFTLCYDRYHRGIYLFVLKYVRCEALAEDIVQPPRTAGGGKSGRVALCHGQEPDRECDPQA